MAATPNEGHPPTASAARMMFTTIGVVFLTEAAVMVFLTMLPPVPPGLEAILDAALLSVFVFPFLYLTIFNPLVRQVESRKRTEVLLRANRFLLAEAQRVAHVGHWVWEIQEDVVTCSEETCRIFGLAIGSRPLSFESFDSRVHPDDRTEVRKVLANAAREGRGYENEHRILLPGGGEKVVYSKGEMECDARGRPFRLIGVVQDITERRTAQRALENAFAELDQRVHERTAELADANRALQRERNFVDAIVDTAGALVVVYDRAGSIVRFNKTCEAISGYTFEEVRSRRFWDVLIPEEDLRGAITAFESICSGEFPIQVENNWRARDGAQHLINWSNTALCDLEGEVEYVIGIGVDFTDRRRAEQALRDSEELYRTMLRTACEGFWTVDVNGTIVEVNDAYCELSGYSRDELVGRHLSMVEAGESRDEVNRHIERIMAEGHDRFETQQRRKDGGIIDVEVSATYIPLRDGLLITFLRDVTDSNLAARELARSRAELEAIIYSTADATVFTDPERRIALVNPAFERMFGYLADEVHGRDTHFLDLERRRDEGLGDGNDDGARGSFEIQCRRKDGSTLWVETQAVEVHDSSGALMGYVGVHRDISQRKKDEKRIRASLLEKEVLLKEIHHRVKNNLQLIASMLNLQLDHVRDEVALAPLRESQNRIRSLALIHEKLYRSLDLARIEFGDYVRDLATTIVASVNRAMVPIAVETDIDEMFFGIDTTIPLGLIINELVSNSIKHAFAGRDEGRIRIALQDDGDGRLRLVVEDNGVGLPDDFGGCSDQTLGLQLVEVLATQLDGTLSWWGESGARFEIEFSHTDSGGRLT